MPLRIRFPPAEDLEVIGWNQTFTIVLRKNLLLSKFYCLCKIYFKPRFLNSLLLKMSDCLHLAQRHYWRGAILEPGGGICHVIGCYKIQPGGGICHVWWICHVPCVQRDWAVTRFNQKQKRERNQQLKQQQQHLVITWLQANSLSNKNIINNNKNENNNNGNNNNWDNKPLVGDALVPVWPSPPVAS